MWAAFFAIRHLKINNNRAKRAVCKVTDTF